MTDAPARIAGYCWLSNEGCRVGTREKTREALVARWEAGQAEAARDMLEHLEAETDERLQAQADYWLKGGGR